MQSNYSSITIAIPVDNSKKAIEWYKEYLNLQEIMVINDDVYELQLTENIWIQFYNSEKQKPIYLRLGVKDINQTISLLKKNQQPIRYGKQMTGIQYIYSELDPFMNKIGFYQLLS